MKKFTPCKRATNSAMYPSLVIRNKFEVVQTNPYQRTYFILDSTPCFSLYCFVTTRLDSNNWIFVFEQITARFLTFVAWSRNISFFSCWNLMTTLETTPNSLFSSALWLHLNSRLFKMQFMFLIFVLETCRCVTVYKQLLFTKLNLRKVFTSWLVDLLY